MYRFLASRRWLVRTLAGVLLVIVCVRLGMWQLDRSEDRSQHNERIEANADAAAVALDDVLEPDAAFDPDDEWRPVEIRGTYDADNQLLLRLRPLEGERGVHVITPLVTDSGAAVLVNRGFYPSPDQIPDAPAPPQGDVEVVARLRPSEEQRGPGGDPAAGHIRAVDLEGLAEVLPYPIYTAWAEAISPIDDQLIGIPPPQPDAGPHLSYAIQWFIFAVIGITGFVLLVRTEARDRRKSQDTDGTAAPDPAPRSPLPR